MSLTRGRSATRVVAPSIVRALWLGRIPPRERGLPIVRSRLVRARTRDAFSNALLYRMPSGIPGDVNRAFAATEEPNILDANYPFLAYGLCGVIDQTDYQFRPAGGSTTNNKEDAAGVLYGILVRWFPTNQPTTTGFFGSSPLTEPSASVPPTSGICDVLKRGYITVLLQGDTAAEPGMPVYVQANGADANTTTDLCGGFHAANDTGTVQAGIAGTTYFRGAADANGNVEIAWNL